MGLFLLGVPLAIMGAKMASNDMKEIHNNVMVSDAPRSIYDQKKEIDFAFKNILELCGASCRISQSYNNNYTYIDNLGNKILISEVKCGQYGNMEQLLFSKGYSKEAIDYCKYKFDKIGKRELQKTTNIIEKRIQDYENAMKRNQNTEKRVKNKVYKFFNQYEVERDCKRIEEYLNKKGHNTQCNIIFGGDMPNVNHSEIWLIKEPKGYNASQYYLDVCHKLKIER